jgi:hypothetical protein
MTSLMLLDEITAEMISGGGGKSQYYKPSQPSQPSGGLSFDLTVDVRQKQNAKNVLIGKATTIFGDGTATIGANQGNIQLNNIGQTNL